MKKNITYFLATLLSVVFLFASCTKKDDSPSYFMKATVGSTAFNVNSCIATTQGTVLGIVGSNGGNNNYPMITFTVANWDGKTGSIALAGLVSNAQGNYYKSGTDIQTSVYGTLEIKSVSTSTISGSFSFKTSDSTSVSSGTFTANRP